MSRSRVRQLLVWGADLDLNGETNWEVQAARDPIAVPFFARRLDSVTEAVRHQPG